MIHLLRMVDTLGLDEVKKLAEDYLHPSNSSGNAQKSKSEKFSLLQLHRFDPFVFARDHKADCQRRLQLSELTSEDKAQAGLTPEQAIERYKGFLRMLSHISLLTINLSIKAFTYQVLMITGNECAQRAFWHLRR